MRIVTKTRPILVMTDNDKEEKEPGHCLVNLSFTF